MADLDPRDVVQQVEGAMPRPEFLASLRERIEREALGRPMAADGAGDVVDLDVAAGRRPGGDHYSPKTLLVAVAAVVALAVGLAVWFGDRAGPTNTDSVDQPDENGAETTTTTPTTTTTVPEVIAAPDVPPPDPSPPVGPSELSLDEWIPEFVAFTENGHEGDWLNFMTKDYGAGQALAADMFDERDGWAFTAMCDLLPYTSGHMADAPGAPPNEAVAAKYQEFLDVLSSRWGWQQAMCDSVDHELVRSGAAAFPPDYIRVLEGEFVRSWPPCRAVVAAVEIETGDRPAAACEPGDAPWEVDRDLPAEFAAFVEE